MRASPSFKWTVTLSDFAEVSIEDIVASSDVCKLNRREQVEEYSQAKRIGIKLAGDKTEGKNF